ncbi:MAG: hypothetical protein K0U49_11510 [Alphaproteobacteria bacterium]|nr:hypothetical protein [Alphaproteobacteria bacterium]
MNIMKFFIIMLTISSLSNFANADDYIIEELEYRIEQLELRDEDSIKNLLHDFEYREYLLSSEDRDEVYRQAKISEAKFAFSKSRSFPFEKLQMCHLNNRKITVNGLKNRNEKIIDYVIEEMEKEILINSGNYSQLHIDASKKFILLLKNKDRVALDSMIGTSENLYREIANLSLFKSVIIDFYAKAMAGVRFEGNIMTTSQDFINGRIIEIASMEGLVFTEYRDNEVDALDTAKCFIDIEIQALNYVKKFNR